MSRLLIVVTTFAYKKTNQIKYKCVEISVEYRENETGVETYLSLTPYANKAQIVEEKQTI